MQLKQLETLPNGVLTCTPEMLHSILPQPTLIHLAGKKDPPLFISVMLHGNEPTGFLAAQSLLKKYQNTDLPRSVTLFFGNTLAAEQGRRRLDGQPDFNRIWPGTDQPFSPESQIAAEIVSTMRAHGIFASIDIHNNTGLNPHYACINKYEPRFLRLASLFGRLIVYFTHPKGVQSAAFAEFCPAVTLECGRPGQQYGVEHAFNFLDSCLHLSEIADDPVPSKDIDIFHTVAQIKIPEHIEFSFSKDTVHLLLDKDLERMNFTEIPAGTVLGKVNHGSQMPVIAKDESGANVTDHFFDINGGELRLNRKSMPSMLTLDERIIQQDCLCYLMERIHP